MPLPQPLPAPGTPAGEPATGLVLGPRCPDGLRRELEAGAVVLFLGANSQDGRAGEEAAVQNLESAVLWAAEWAGVDVQHLLPDTDDLTRAFRVDGVPLAAGRDLKTGKPLKTRRLGRRLAPNVLIHLSTGSRAKLDDRTRSNAVSDDIGETIYANTVCLVVVHEGTRLLRLPTAVAPIANSLWALSLGRHVHPWVYFGDTEPPARWSDEVEQKLWEIGKAGKKEVADFAHRGTSGIIAKVGPRFVEGWVRYGLSRPSPAGTERAWLKPADRRGRPRHIIYVDEPDCRPELTEVASGRLAERAIRGEPVVNQAELVCWFLEHFGSPGWGYEECADYLVGHGFRTPALFARGQHPEHGYQRRTEAGKSLARNICRTILKDLDFYLTEQIVVRGVNVDGSDHIIQGFRPLARPWMTRADHDRILAYLAPGRARRRNTAGCTFVGWLVRTPLGLGRLAAHRRADGRVVYYVVELHSRRHLGTRDCRLPTIDHALLARAYVEGIIKNRDALGPLLDAGETTDEVDEARIRALHEQIAEQRKQEESFELKWRHLDGPALVSAKRDLNALTASRQANESELRVLDARGRAAQGPSLHGVPLRGLLRFVASLRDPADVTYRAVFLDGASQLDLRPADPTAPGAPSDAWLWSATAAFHDEHRSWSVPIEVTTPAPRSGARPNPCPDWLEAWVDQLRDGVPYSSLPGSADRKRLRLLRRVLRIPAGQHFRFAGERDPRLLRLQMAVKHPPPARRSRARPAGEQPRETNADPAGDSTFGLLAGSSLTRRQLPALAKRLGEPLALLQAIHDVYVTQPAPGQPRSLRVPNGALATAYALAARTGRVSRARMPGPDYQRVRRSLRDGPFAEDWDLEPGAIRLRPCPHCGHQRRVPLRIVVAAGAVCTRCRMDRAGVPWPAVPYDHYRDRPPKARLARAAPSAGGSTTDSVARR